MNRFLLCIGKNSLRKESCFKKLVCGLMALLNAPPAKRHKKGHFTFDNRCREWGVPSLGELTPRQAEHMNACEPCAHTWPLFVFRRTRTEGKTWAEAVEEWHRAAESTREAWSHQLSRAQAKENQNLARRRVVSAYNVFFRHQHRDKEFGQLPFGERSVRVRERWKAMDPDEKHKFQELARKEEEAKQLYEASLPACIREEIVELRRRKRKRRTHGKPLRPLNAYFLYQQECIPRMQEQQPDLLYKHMVRRCAAAWRDLSPQEKKPYQDAAHQTWRAYRDRVRAAQHLGEEDDEEDE